MTDIVERLRSACNGKPAEIAWPHRILHDAAAEIERLRTEIAWAIAAIDGDDIISAHERLTAALEKFNHE